MTAACGTRTAYNTGCRCQPCREAQRIYVATRRAEARNTGYTRLTHGRTSTYDAGCRCKPCARTRSARSSGNNHTRYRPRIMPTGTCPACHRHIAITTHGHIVAHGPVNQRCPGTHRHPVERQAAA